MMSEYFEVITDAVTGEQTIRPYTQEEIDAHLKASVPQSITPRQCRLILLQQGLLDEVEQMIAEQDRATRLTWEYATESRRDDPLLNGLAANLSLTSGQIDQFFIAAAQL
jgi:hypothetical protein